MVLILKNFVLFNSLYSLLPCPLPSFLFPSSSNFFLLPSSFSTSIPFSSPHTSSPLSSPSFSSPSSPLLLLCLVSYPFLSTFFSPSSSSPFFSATSPPIFFYCPLFFPNSLHLASPVPPLLFPLSSPPSGHVEEPTSCPVCQALAAMELIHNRFLLIMSRSYRATRTL